MGKFTTTEIILLIITTIAVAGTITLCLCIHYIIPDTGCHNIKYVRIGENKTQPISGKRSRVIIPYCINPTENPTTTESATTVDENITSTVMSIYSNIVPPVSSTSAPVLTTSTLSTPAIPIRIPPTTSSPTTSSPTTSVPTSSSTLSTQSHIMVPYPTTPIPKENITVPYPSTPFSEKVKRNVDSTFDNSTIHTSIDSPFDCNCPKLNNSLETEILISRPTNYTQRIHQYPYLVSISMPIWLDDIFSDERIYKTAGVIINKDSVLTGKYVSDEEWFMVTIRAGSDFWSFGGTTHLVVSVDKYEGNVILKVTPEFYFSDYVKSLKSSSDSEDWISAKLVGWDSGKLKYNTYEAEIVDKSIISCANCTGDGTFKCNTSKPGNILVLDDDSRVLF